MANRFRILAALLRYPEAELIAALPEIRAAIAAAGFARAHARALDRLCGRLAAGDLLDHQEAYVRLFDRNRSTALHLFEHVHGDNRNRGPAMIELAQLYENHGLAIAAAELPDYLPLMLEFLSLAPAEVAANLLDGAAPIVDALHAKLAGRPQPAARAYAAVLAATLAEAGRATTAKAAPEDLVDDDNAAIDRAWEDAPVVFGPESDPDPKSARARVGAMIDRLRAVRARPQA